MVNNVKVKIEDGIEIFYVIILSSGGMIIQIVSFKVVKLLFEVIFQIMLEGMVCMVLIVKKEEVDFIWVILGNLLIKSLIVEINVVVENGGIVVIGGVYIINI